MFKKHYKCNTSNTLPSSIISIIQVNEGLIQLFFTHINIPMKLSLNNINAIIVLSYHLTIVAQMVVDCLVRRNQFFRSSKFILKLMNNLFMLKKKIKMEQLPLQKKQL
jgi:hypothetical protein